VTPRTVLITGAGRGVGRAAAAAFVKAGWRVIAGVRDVTRARKELSAGAEVVQLDVTRPEEISAVVASVGRIDCLVNNAAYALVGAQEDADLAAVRTMFETNLFGAAALTQAVLPGMRERRAGAIIQISSVGAWMSSPLVGFYHATKYGLTALSEALALEVRPFGVRVVLIEPGMIDSDFSKATVVSGSTTTPEGPYAETFAGLRGGFAKWRAGETSSPEDVASAILGAAEDPTTPFRVLVGADAELLHRSHASSRDDIEWQGRLLNFLGMETPGQ
jgi:NAD(P)-dependent dehydrogenase (short-subunit alcohol dehydrogenase family)